jgi:hypothetical protein
MEILILFFIISVILAPTGWWIKGVDHMQKNHHDYNGDDLI